MRLHFKAEPGQIFLDELQQRQFIVDQHDSSGGHAYQMARGFSPGLYANPMLTRLEFFLKKEFCVV